MIDDAQLLTLIEESVEGPWLEKKQAMVNSKALKNSAKGSGSFDILVCAHCASSGYIAPDDLLLSAFEVKHIDDFITWEVRPPSLEEPDEVSPLEFRFHKPQYIKEVEKLFSEDE